MKRNSLLKIVNPILAVLVVNQILLSGWIVYGSDGV